MFKEWVKQFLCVLIAMITILTPVSDVYAADYIKNSSSAEDGEATYYIIDGQDVSKLFDFKIKDMKNAVSWILNFKTYTVIKNYTNTSGDSVYKVYFNAPNLQSIVKNRVISNIDDGYTDETYKVENTEWIVPVGASAGTENVITKYGFEIPNYEYQGEFPKAIMSAANLLPAPKWYEIAWTAIKALFGCSFIKAPDAETFNTITYLNHTYKDKSDYILDYFKKYYLTFFERKIPGVWDDGGIFKEGKILSKANEESPSGDDNDVKHRNYFKNADEAIKLSVTEDQYKAALRYNRKYKKDYAEAVQRKIYWEYFEEYKSKIADDFAEAASWTGDSNAKYILIDYMPGLVVDDMWDSFLAFCGLEEPNGIHYKRVGDDIHVRVENQITLKTEVADDLYEEIIYDPWHFVTQTIRYKQQFMNYINTDRANHLRILYVILNSTKNVSNKYKYGVNNPELTADTYYKNEILTDAESYGFSKSGTDYSFSLGSDNITQWNYMSIAADIYRYAEDNMKCNVLHDKLTRVLKDTRTTVVTKDYEQIKVSIEMEWHSSDGYVHWYGADNPYVVYLNSSSDGGWGDSNAYTSISSPTVTTKHEINGVEKDSSHDNDDESWIFAVPSDQDIEETDVPYNDTVPYREEDNTYTRYDSPIYDPEPAGSWTTNPTTHSPSSHSQSVYSTSTYEEETNSSGDVTTHAYDLANADSDFTAVMDANNKIYYDSSTGKWRIRVPGWVIDVNCIKKVTVEKAENHWTETTVETKTKTSVKYNNYRLRWIWDGFDSNDGRDDENHITYAEYKVWHDDYGMNSPRYIEDDFVPAEKQTIYNNYNHNVELIDDYRTFMKYYKLGQDPDDYDADPAGLENPRNEQRADIPYRQCMITNEGEDGDCYSTKYGDGKTSLTILNVYAYSGIYKVTQDIVGDSSVRTLTDAQAAEILAKLQSYCGPYYTDVLANMMKLMASTALYDYGEGSDAGPIRTIVSDDPRVMPYDNGSQLYKDAQNYAITDPRVDMYKDRLLGGLISDFSVGFSLKEFFRFQPKVINLCGKITELSIFMQELCDFDMLDSWGLSPATMWTSSFTVLLYGALVLFFIFKTVAAIIKMGTKGASKVIIGFIVLFLELGITAAIAANPDGTWTTIKNVNKKVISVGELVSSGSDPSLTYLFGDAEDSEVLYYLPYLDIWSKYNTGYGILDSQQKINTTTDTAELAESTGALPSIGSNQVQHWSVVLMDAFSYHGHSNSVVNVVVEDGEVHNGAVINNNAYRVVDHFMAPRITIGSSGDNLTLTAKQNENYNSQFQSGWSDLFAKMLNCCLGCFLSLIKVLTFLWFWFCLYIFIFKVVLGLTAEQKKMTIILGETFGPLLALLMIGLYSGIVLNIGMSVGGLLGVIILLFLFWLTLMIIRWWHDLGARVNIFPKTLTWIYILTNMSRYRQLRENEKRRMENKEKYGELVTMRNLDDEENEALHEGYTMNDQYNRDAISGFGRAFDKNGTFNASEMANENNKEMTLAGYYEAYILAYKDNPRAAKGEVVHNFRNSTLRQRVAAIEASNTLGSELQSRREAAWEKVNGTKRKNETKNQNYEKIKNQDEQNNQNGQKEGADSEN